jgi:hypothetical protein
MTQPLYVMKTSLSLLNPPIHPSVEREVKGYLHEHKCVKVLQSIQDGLDEVGALVGLSLGLS